MTLLLYYLNHFESDLRKLLAYGSHPSPSQCDLRPELNGCVFFGGRQWAHYEKEIAHVPEKNRVLFCVSLLSIIAADKNNHAHLASQHETWRSAFAGYPKFGWIGFGPHFEDVKFLCSIPEEAGVNFDAFQDDELDEFVLYHRRQGSKFLGPHVEYAFLKMVEDPEFNATHPMIERLRNSIIRVFNFNGLE